MRKTALVRCLGGAAAVAIWIASTILGPAHAQHGAEFSTFELFPDADSIDPKPDVVQRLADAIRKAQSPGKCPLGRLKIRTPNIGDAMFQASVAATRQQVVLQVLDSLGVPVAGRLFVESTVFGNSSGHDTVYEVPRDRKPPKLNTTSVPRKGSKVKAGDRIKVTMIARDDPDPWPTGIKTIQLVADSDRGRFVASENYEPCAQPAERRVEATYLVPSNPPPIVRLTALAEDHAGLMDTDVGEFPTGDWYGRLEWSMRTGTTQAWTRIFGTADLAVSAVGQGKLAGSIVGTANMDGNSPECPHVRTIAPTVGRARLTGSYKPGADTMTLAAEQVEPVSQGRISKCMGTELPAPTAEVALLLHTDKLQKRTDNTFHASGTTQWGGKFSLTLSPAR
jgi:hypothetical protein